MNETQKQSQQKQPRQKQPRHKRMKYPGRTINAEEVIAQMQEQGSSEDQIKRMQEYLARQDKLDEIAVPELNRMIRQHRKHAYALLSAIVENAKAMQYQVAEEDTANAIKVTAQAVADLISTATAEGLIPKEKVWAQAGEILGIGKSAKSKSSRSAATPSST